jgi:aconitate hydratase
VKELEEDYIVCQKELNTPFGSAMIYDLNELKEDVSSLPYSLKVLLENLVRNFDNKIVLNEHVDSLVKWDPQSVPLKDIPFKPSRVVLQDFTGVPAVVDLAALRWAAKRNGGDPELINPQIPVDLVIDHSVQVDHFGGEEARKYNEEMEYKRNHERYALLRWAQEAYLQFRVVPPGRGIVHQVNLEYLANVVHFRESNGKLLAYPDTLLGTDSHTTMINGLGVLGWGVGGIEAEVVMLGQTYYIPIPEVVGFRLVGQLKEDVFATDLVLYITKILRKENVVGKFIEFFGPGLENLSLPDRATIANMSPEYGATMGFFPIDEVTLEYLLLTGRAKEQVELVRNYSKLQGLFYEDSKNVLYTKVIELDMGKVGHSLAGPKRPQDRIPIENLATTFHERRTEDPETVHFEHDFDRFLNEGGDQDLDNPSSENVDTKEIEIHEVRRLINGSVVIAAITSCTNTSNPSVMIGAGLLAKKAIEKGLSVKPWVKTSLAPGSRVVTEYLKATGLDEPLESLGFYLVGYGCTTCIGNSGPLPDKVTREIRKRNLTVAAVLSGNRNFEGRIHHLVKSNFLASPPLVIAYALVGSVDIDLKNEHIGHDKEGNKVYLKDIWPQKKEIADLIEKTVNSDMFRSQYSEIFSGTNLWDELEIPEGNLYLWEENSTYIREPTFFVDFPRTCPVINDINGARVLALLGDSITTDHISPAGAILENSPAGEYLVSKNVSPSDFNSFGSRRGNHEVMMRGTFGNVRLRNQMVPDREGGWTKHFPSGEEMPIYNAAMKYIEEGIPTIILVGKEYGTGSSRDWAAKGTFLLGVKAVIAKSYERIHRSNLVGMGVLPLQFLEGQGAEELGLSGEEVIDILEIENVKPKGKLKVNVKGEGEERSFEVLVRLDSEVEIEYYRNKGILHKFLRDNLAECTPVTKVDE